MRQIFATGSSVELKVPLFTFTAAFKKQIRASFVGVTYRAQHLSVVSYLSLPTHSICIIFILEMSDSVCLECHPAWHRFRHLSFSAPNARPPPTKKSRDSSVRIVTVLQAVPSSNLGGISGRGQNCISSQKRPNQFWISATTYPMGTDVTFTRVQHTERD
jgi:hypothetical protein